MPRGKFNINSDPKWIISCLVHPVICLEYVWVMVYVLDGFAVYLAHSGLKNLETKRVFPCSSVAVDVIMAIVLNGVSEYVTHVGRKTGLY